MHHVVAVIDIGMTNKKVAVYEWPVLPGSGAAGGDPPAEAPRLVESVSRTFDPEPVDGLETHDLAGMEAWFLDRLADVSRRHRIGAIAVSTHGATMVCLGADGEPCVPCVLYTHEPGPEFRKRFYDLAGDPLALQADTGTPDLSALINPAKGLMFAKERFPRGFSAARTILNYPQYWGFRPTGAIGAESTYVACHTYLWDWRKGGYSSVARALGVADRMPSEIRGSHEVLGTLRPGLAERLGMDPGTIVTMGIHDSNASILPHMVKRRGRDFVLNSTGTWCVLMHPCASYGFSPDELGKVVFFNRSAFLEPVKTAIFLGGFEYSAWSSLVARHGGPVPDTVPAEIYARIVAERRLFILPELVPGSGQFPGSAARAVEDGVEFPVSGIGAGRTVPDFLGNPQVAAAVLNLSLAVQTIVALRRTGLDPGCDVFTEGGFRKNPDYCAILAAALPDNPCRLTDLAEATSFGAAMTGVAALSGRPLGDFGGDFDIEYRHVLPMEGLDDFPRYMQAMLALVEDAGRAEGVRT